MSETVMSIKDVGVGGFIMEEGEPYKILKIEFAKAGKHGSAKARIEVVGIFDNKRRSLLKLGDADVSVPIIEKKSAQVISVSGNLAQLMDLADYATFEATIQEELRAKIQPGAEIGYWKFNERILLKG